jgi:RNA polymerase sigma factor (sigma-70 family)
VVSEKTRIVPDEQSARVSTTPRIPEETTSSGEALFLANLGVIDRVIGFVCRRHHLNPADAEDFASHARLALMDDEYAVLRKFQGRSSLKTFLSITVQRIFFDYRIAAWGKWRPSAEARRRGPVAVLLEQLIGRESYSLEEAFEMIATTHRVAISRADLEELAAHLPARARRRFESEEALATLASGDAADEEVLGAERRREADRIGDALQAEVAAMAPQDRLILRLRFDDGRTVADIAAMLRLEQKPLYRRLEKILRDLRTGLEARGVDAAAVSELIREASFERPTKVADPETPPESPSTARGANA